MIIFDFNTGDGGLIDKIIVKSSTIPEAGESYAGAVYQYVGETGTYTHGYIYECVSETNTTAVIDLEPHKIVFDEGDLVAFFESAGDTSHEVVSGRFKYYETGDIWNINGLDENGNTVFSNYQVYTQDLVDAGFVVIVPMTDITDEEEIEYEVRYLEQSVYNWERLNVQPGISPEGETEQTVQGDLTLTSTDGAVGLSFENSSSSSSIGINSNGDLILSSTDGSVVVNTPDGTNEDAVVNVAYVNNIVGDIDTALDDIIAQ